MLSGDIKAIVLKREEMEILFDIIIHTKKDALICMYLQRNKAMAKAMGGVPKKGACTYDADEGAWVHILLGHPSMEYTESIAKHLGWELTELNN